MMCATRLITLVLLSLSWTVTGIDWCGLRCPKYPTALHTMCGWQEGGDESCKTWTQGLTAAEKQIVLDYHNMLRDKIASGQETQGIGGPQPMAADMMELVWDNEAAEIAQRWADQCQLEMDHDKCRVASDNTYTGQNLAFRGWMGTAHGREEVMKMLTQDWYDEIVDFYTEDVDRVFLRSDPEKVGHYTQLIWAKSERLGCGFGHYQEGVVGQSYFRLYCNYKKGGNIGTQQIYSRSDVDPGEWCPSGTSTKYPNLCKPRTRGDELRDTLRERKEAPALSPESQQAEDFRATQERISSGQTPGFTFTDPNTGRQVVVSSSGQMTPDQMEAIMKQYQGSQGFQGSPVTRVFQTTSNTPLTQEQMRDMMGTPQPTGLVQSGAGVVQPVSPPSQPSYPTERKVTETNQLSGQTRKPVEQSRNPAAQSVPAPQSSPLGRLSVPPPIQPENTQGESGDTSPSQKAISLWHILTTPKFSLVL